MMNDEQLLQSLAKLVDAKTIDALKKTLIFKDGNQYILFQKYIIHHETHGYKIVRMTDDSTYSFTSLKYAVTWVTLDKCDMVYESNRVRYLDMILAGIEVSSLLYDHYLKTVKSMETRFIYSNKLKENSSKKKEITKELDLFATKAKARQMARFNQRNNK
jgi:hypothetical protein